MPARNDSPRVVLRETGDYELERALKQLAQAFAEARKSAGRGMSYVPPRVRRRNKSLRAQQRVRRFTARRP